MKFGCCVGIENIGVVQSAGYDYVELPVVAVLAEKPESEFAPIEEKIRSYSIKPYAWNILLPKEIKVTGPDVDPYRQERYLQTALERVSRLGGEVVVFGSGGARSVPEGFPYDKAREQIEDFLTIAARAARDHHVRIAIEPLNQKECNIINTVAEAADIAASVGDPNIRVLADFYHIDEENEPFSDIVDAGLWLIHAHTADTNRYRPGSGNYDHLAFFRALNEACYNGALSVECKWNDFESECREALEFLRETEAKARE